MFLFGPAAWLGFFDRLDLQHSGSRPDGPVLDHADRVRADAHGRCGPDSGIPDAGSFGQTFPYLILDARYEKVREAGVILSQAMLVAVAVDEDGRRQILAVELANRESRSSWRDFLLAPQSPRARRRRVCRPATTIPVSRRRSARCCRRRRGSAAMCIFSETRSTMCRARSTTTACGSCAGFTTAAISPKCAATSPPRWPNGRPSTRGCATGSRTTSRRR